MAKVFGYTASNEQERFSPGMAVHANATPCPFRESDLNTRKVLVNAIDERITALYVGELRPARQVGPRIFEPRVGFLSNDSRCFAN